MPPAIHWFRRDLRLTDNPALQQALEQGGPLYLVYIHAPEEEAPWSPGAASRWWLHRSLEALAADIARRGGRLILRRGPSRDALQDLLAETGARRVTWNRLYEPALIARDRQIKTALRAQGVDARSGNGHLLLEPWELATGKGDPYRVFTPFWRAAQRRLDALDEAQAAPSRLPAGRVEPKTLALDDLGLIPDHPWPEKLAGHWQPGESGALDRLEQFVAEALAGYGRNRDYPAEPATSRLSPHLHFGELGPRQALLALRSRPPGEDAQRFAAELGWREFAHHLLFHFPETPEKPLNPRFAAFPWRDGPQAEADYRAWTRGRTGIALVDAGMRELWDRGWMHNRMRMLVGSLLTKNLRLDWRRGAGWFWDTLVDADLASNTLGWQWIAGCGADAAPYFRIFNPDTQAEKFDPDGAYRQRWLAGREPVEPIVDLKASRREALAAFETIKR